MVIRFYCIIFLLIFVSCNSRPNDKNQIIKRTPFGHEIDNIKPHHLAEFGSLDNGFRYILLPIESKGGLVDSESYLAFAALYVNVGSLNENDNQQGMANFLKKMILKGTKNYSADKIEKIYKKIRGHPFAMSDLEYTYFDTHMTNQTYLEETIAILSDYARNLKLNPDEIEKERKEILNEKIYYYGLEKNSSDKDVKLTMPDSLFAKRFPRGIDDTIKNFKELDFMEFYHTWYRPDNMVLIIIGDFDKKNCKKYINKYFKTFSSNYPKLDRPKIDNINLKGIKVNYLHIKKEKNTKIEIRTIFNKAATKENYWQKKRREIAQEAIWDIFNARLFKKVYKKDSEFSGGRVEVGKWLNYLESGYISLIVYDSNDWASTLTFTENELRSYLSFGISKEELDLFKLNYLKKLIGKIESGEVYSFCFFDILDSLQNNTPFQDRYQVFNFEKSILEDLTKEDVMKELKRFWEVDHRIISVSGGAVIKNPEIEIKRVYEESTKLEVLENKQDIKDQK